MKVKWLGHASFLITADDGTRIITDPYKSQSDGGLVGYAKINEAADVVTVSHEHNDHNHTADVGGSPEVVRGAGPQDAKGIRFHGVATYHDTEQGAQRGANTVFCFDVDGVKFCHLGDLGHQLSSRQLSEIGEVDVLLAVAGGGPTIDLEALNRLVENMKPKAVIPMHFTNENCTYTKYTAEDFASGKSDVQRLGESETAISAADLPGDTRVIVLDHAL